MWGSQPCSSGDPGLPSRAVGGLGEEAGLCWLDTKGQGCAGLGQGRPGCGPPVPGQPCMALRDPEKLWVSVHPEGGGPLEPDSTVSLSFPILGTT